MRRSTSSSQPSAEDFSIITTLPGVGRCDCAAQAQQAVDRLVRDRESLLDLVRRSWGSVRYPPRSITRKGMFEEWCEAQADKLFDQRDELVRGRLLPHLQDALECLATYCQVVSPPHEAIPAAAAAHAAWHVTDIGEWQATLAEAARVLLLTDARTWSFIEALEAHELVDGHLAALVERRRRVGEVGGLDYGDRQVRRAARATADILQAITVQSPSPLTPHEGVELLHEVQQAVQARLALLQQVDYKRDQARELGQEFAASLRRHLPQAEINSTSEITIEAAERQRKATQAVHARTRQLADEVKVLTTTYTITSTELRTKGWGALAADLIAGDPDSERPGFPKPEVRSFLGLLKLLDAHVTDRAMPDDVPAALGDALQKEAALREEIGQLLTVRGLLEDDARVVDWLHQLHLAASVQWMQQHWEMIGAIVDLHTRDRSVSGRSAPPV